MANQYLYGAYGHLGETVAQSAVQAGTTPVYVGVAPINLVRNYKDVKGVNSPVKLNNFVDAQRKMGISQDWEKFSLCEVMTAHFNNPIGNIGPIYVINVLDPEAHKKTEQSTKSLTFVNGRAEFVSDTIILDTVAIADKAEGVDYSLDYNYTKNSVVITSLSSEEPLSGLVSVTYYDVDLSKITAKDIIGGVTANGQYTGLGALKLLYQEQFQVCNLLAAPGWSHEPEVYNALISAAQKINGHWDAFVCADIPLEGAELSRADMSRVGDARVSSKMGGEAIDTIQKAVDWKKANGYTNERSKVFWPMAQDNAGQVFHLSTLAMVELMRADYSHNSVPMETCGNKEVQVIKQYFGPDSTNQGYDQQAANDLTMNGIGTVIAWGGNWVLWGDHTAAYSYGADVDPRAIFDVSMRMLFHITNGFQREWSPKIDKPMTLQLRDRILNREQEKLDALVSQGALIGEPKILFLESENSTTDLMNGDFRWDINATPTPPLKSATVYVSYTDAGFSAYFGE